MHTHTTARQQNTHDSRTNHSHKHRVRGRVGDRASNGTQRHRRCLLMLKLLLLLIIVCEMCNVNGYRARA